MSLISYFSILLYFLLANLTTTIISKRTFGKCLPLTFMGCAFSLFFSQIIFKSFNILFYASIIYALFSIVYVIVIRKDKNKLKVIKENYFTSGFYAFIIITSFVTIFDFNRLYSHWDEYSHWGEMLKEMVRIDKFYSVPQSVLQAHKDYPPLLQLFELFIIKLCMGYKETYAIVALHLLELSLFVPVICEKINNKKNNIFIGTFFSIIFIFLVTLIFDQHGVINSIYNDYFLAVLAAYGLSIVIFSEDKTSKFTLVNISLASSFLLLTKQIGLPLYLMIIFLYFGFIFIDDRKNQIKIISKKNVIRIIKISIVIIIFPLLLWAYWNNHVKSVVNIPIQFNLSDIELGKLYDIYRGKSGRYDQKLASTNFLKLLKGKNITESYVELSYFQAIVIALFAIYMIWYKNKKILNKKQLIYLLITLAIGSLGYAFVMYCTYVFCFRDGEAINVASFERYMSTYILIAMYIAIMLFIYTCFKNKNIKPLVVISIIAFVLTRPDRLFDIYPKLTQNLPNHYEVKANILKSKVEDNAKVFIVAQNTNGAYQFFIKYYANPIINNMYNYNWPISTDEDNKEYYESIKGDIINYDYLYIAVADERFIKNYDFVFTDNKPSEDQLYKIVKNSNDEDYKLELVK